MFNINSGQRNFFVFIMSCYELANAMEEQQAEEVRKEAKENNFSGWFPALSTAWITAQNEKAKVTATGCEKTA